MPYEALDSVVYTMDATAEGGRDGHVKSEDGVIDVVLGKPGSKSNPKANPETLFAAGYASCFSGALNAVASRAGHDTSESTVTASVSLGKTGEGFGLAVKLVAHIPGVDEATAQQLVEQAHQFCPYSKATRGNIDVTVSVA
ncbi:MULTISPECIES: organic hydroperoxide resistance protein [Allobranchiibius]|uniref:Ohr subfamily peroxiredoxin n=1 Tax=Allobranchiibius huperziae TaxID=1874116 RepID=A0A853DLQ0_9MICO|nr:MULTISPECIES: organic hydroperoxide resistance protein [Allobranchiibius]MBO1767891.1 organic hydroperoxide resistance protein [Allobranchiibius sp. GilTou38]NYJ75661.1 Ohr subfamily peroxiredoxin [Allobranchiibius huperziae]UIJ36194.1 organic hydroperoxide resistance protein [Allobranchiibius sp. GilTou73]